MTKRTREHELESESFKKFESLIPSKWVFRKKSDDYGIDGEIEIFDEEGKTTGHLIYVQLKSTDSDKSREYLKESIKVDTLRYYSQLEYPVLIAKYSSKLDRIYFRWTHSKNKNPIKPNQKTTTIHFPAENILDSSSFRVLKSDTANYLKYHRQKLFPPYKFGLIFNNTAIKKTELILKFKEYAKSHRHNIELVDVDDENAIGKIYIKEDNVTLSLGGDCATFTFSLPNSLNTLLCNLYIAFAVLVDVSGGNDIAAILALDAYKESSIFDNSGMLEGLLKCFYDSKKYEELMEACNWAIDEKDAIDEVRLFSMMLYRHFDRASEKERVLVENLCLMINEYYIEHSILPGIASSHYNLGNFYMGFNKLQKAFHHHNLARKAEPNYLERSYFWRELGVILYDKGRIHCANKAYKNALDIKEELDVRAKYADTLLYMGKYSMAIKELKAYLESNKSPNPFWCLKLNTLEHLLESYGIKDGKRDREASSALLTQANPVDEATMLKALIADPLNQDIWFEIGHICYDKKEFEESFWAYLWTALLSDSNLEAWAYSFFIAFSCMPKGEETIAMLSHIFGAAYQRNGMRFISYMFNFIEERVKIDDTQKEGLKSIILQMAEALPNENSLEFRLIDENHNISTFSI